MQRHIPTHTFTHTPSWFLPCDIVEPMSKHAKSTLTYKPVIPSDTSIFRLPKEIIFVIFFFCDVGELLVLSMTCKSFWLMIYTNEVIYRKFETFCWEYTRSVSLIEAARDSYSPINIILENKYHFSIVKPDEEEKEEIPNPTWPKTILALLTISHEKFLKRQFKNKQIWIFEKGEVNYDKRYPIKMVNMTRIISLDNFNRSNYVMFKHSGSEAAIRSDHVSVFDFAQLSDKPFDKDGIFAMMKTHSKYKLSEEWYILQSPVNQKGICIIDRTYFVGQKKGDLISSLDPLVDWIGLTKFTLNFMFCIHKYMASDSCSRSICARDRRISASQKGTVEGHINQWTCVEKDQVIFEEGGCNAYTEFIKVKTEAERITYFRDRHLWISFETPRMMCNTVEDGKFRMVDITIMKLKNPIKVPLAENYIFKKWGVIKEIFDGHGIGVIDGDIAVDENKVRELARNLSITEEGNKTREKGWTLPKLFKMYVVYRKEIFNNLTWPKKDTFETRSRMLSQDEYSELLCRCSPSVDQGREKRLKVE